MINIPRGLISLLCSIWRWGRLCGRCAFLSVRTISNLRLALQSEFFGQGMWGFNTYLRNSKYKLVVTLFLLWQSPKSIGKGIPHRDWNNNVSPICSAINLFTLQPQVKLNHFDHLQLFLTICVQEWGYVTMCSAWYENVTFVLAIVNVLSDFGCPWGNVWRTNHVTEPNSNEPSLPEGFQT